MGLIHWLSEYEGIIAVLIAVMGWLANHKLTIKAQNKAFLNQIRNEARKEISKNLREYQMWLGDVCANIVGLEIASIVENQEIRIHWLEKHAESCRIFFQPNSEWWLFILEEYEILFPESRHVRMQLIDRHRAIRSLLETCLGGLTESKERRIEVIRSVKNQFELLLDQMALIEDLKIYFQNRVLSSITGNEVPIRKPKDSSLPRIVLQNGNLTIAGK